MLLASCLALAACVPDDTPPIQIAINGFPTYEFLYLAQEKGCYQEAGVQAKVVEFSGLYDSQRAVRDGRVDIIATSIADLALLRARHGIDFRAVWVIDESTGADVILARSGISQLRELKGRTIGLELGSLGAVVLAGALQQAGLRFADVKLVDLDVTAGEKAFRSGQIDALVTYPPFSNRLSSEKILFDSRSLPGAILDVLAVDAKLLADRPEDVQRVIAAYLCAWRFHEAHPAESVRVMASRERIDDATFQRLLHSGLKIPKADEQADYLSPAGKLEQALDKTGQALLSVGLIQTAPLARDMIHQPTTNRYLAGR